MRDLLNILRSSRYTHRPCLYLAIAVGIGICLGRYGPWTWQIWSILSGLFIVAGLFKTRLSVFLLHLAVCFLGAFYYQSTYLFPHDHIAFLSYQDQKKLTAVEGFIDSDVQERPTSFGTKEVFELQLSRIKVEDTWRSASGRVLVNYFGKEPLEYGQKLNMEGSVYKAFTNTSSRFSYQQYLEDHGLFLNLSVGKNKKLEILSKDQGRWWAAISYKIKHRFKKVLAQYLEPQEADMIQAMVLGDRSYLTKDVYAMFSKTGTSHILAISGMNMAIISAMLLFLLNILRFPRTWQFILTGIFLLAYAFLSGWSASVVRSVLMAIVILSSFCVEYEADTINSLGLAALILFLMNPLNLFDIGFQLSFISVGIIVCSYPMTQSFIECCAKGKILKYVLQAFFISLIAWIGISGIIAYEFEIISPIAIIANIPIVPLADLVIVLSLGLVTVGLFSPPLAFAFAGTLKVVFNFLLILVSWFAQIPGGYFYIHSLSGWWFFAYYILLMGIYLIIRPKNLSSCT